MNSLTKMDEMEKKANFFEEIKQALAHASNYLFFRSLE
jgi:hypothetical protein